MPRRNLVVLIAVVLVSLLCYQKVQSSRWGSILADAMGEVQKRSLYPVEPYDLFEGAMQGMISRLDDPYSVFIGPKMLRELDESLNQEFGGVGMQVSLDPESQRLTVMSPLVDTPAHKAGILSGDVILEIDGEDTKGFSLAEAVARLRGKPGQPVTLLVLHSGEKEPVEITVPRAVIQIDTVLGDTRDEDGSWNFFLGVNGQRPRIGYLRLVAFADKTVEELRRALDWLVAHRMQGLVLDLRDDPGGLLGAAVEVCDLFIPEGVIVTTRGRGENIRRTFYASEEGTYSDFPIVVLVNQYTASAAEILAACLQDYRRAVVIGQRTWGKGTVQEVLEMPAGRGAIKLTTASYWRPSGKNIHKTEDTEKNGKWGVKPDDGFEVSLEEEELKKLRLWRLKRDNPRFDESGLPTEESLSHDPQLDKALEYLRAEIAKEKAKD